MFSIMKNNITAKNMRLGVTEKGCFCSFFPSYPSRYGEIKMGVAKDSKEEMQIFAYHQILDKLDALIYITDIETDEIFVYESRNEG